jgi:putative redox protein
MPETIQREVIAEWKGESGFVGVSSTGGQVQMGRVNDIAGVSPMEMLLLGLAGCTGVDIVEILIKKRKDVRAFTVKVCGLRAEDYPKIWKQIEVTYELWGDNLDPKAVEHAIQLSEEKYCSVGLMLQASAQIHSAYILHPSSEIANSSLAETF